MAFFTAKGTSLRRLNHFAWKSDLQGWAGRKSRTPIGMMFRR